MKIKEIFTVEREVTNAIICDSCGESCKIDIYGISNYNYMKLKSNFIYGSKKDGERWTAQICEKCVDEKLSFINFNKKQ